MNVITLVGRLGDKPEIRYHDGGSSKATVNLATDRPGKKSDDGKVTDWHRLEVWNKSGENFTEFGEKGRLVAVTGSLEYSQYENSEGQKVKNATINVKDWEFLDSKKDRQEGQEGPSNVGQTSQATRQGSTASAAPLDDYDAIPF